MMPTCETCKPYRVQLSRKKGWRMPENTVKVDRTTKWGNPFNLRDHSHCWTALAHGFKGDPAGRHAASVVMFRNWLLEGHAVRIQDCGLWGDDGKKRIAWATSPALEAPRPPTLAEIREELKDKNLACWCKPDQPCHADVLLELANKEPQ